MNLKIRIHKKLAADDLLLFLSALFVVTYGLLQNISYAFPFFSQLKFPILYAGMGCMLFQIPTVLRKLNRRRYFHTLLLLGLLCGMLMITAYVNRVSIQSGYSPVRYTLRLVLFLIELYVLMIWAAEKGKVQPLLRFLFRYAVLWTVLTDVLLFTRAMQFSSGRHEIYLIGNKFNVSFMHMNLMVLWYLRNDMHFYRSGRVKRFILPAMLFLLVLSIRIDCMTGLVGFLVLVALLLLLNTQLQKTLLSFESPWLLCLFLAGSLAFPFVVDAIVSIPAVTYVLEEVLMRDTSLTGRTLAFHNFTGEIAGHWLWGFGYGNGYAAALKLFGIANAQNALLQWFLETGVLTTAVFVLLLVRIVRPVRTSPWRRETMPLLLLVYLYIILGTVEITFDENFLFWMAMIFGQVNDQTPRLEEQDPGQVTL